MSKLETQQVEAEVVEAGAGQESLPAINEEKFAGIIRLAEQADKIGAALDKVRKFVLGRALPNDWVKFGEKLELTGPGAERIAAALGISYVNWKDWKESGTDANGAWYTWYYQADVRLGDRVLENVQGRASSRDRFFGYENGKWKDLSEVKEADIRTAARRCVIKEGVKLSLGIRGIPADSAASLGLDPSKVREVKFGKRGESESAAATPGKPVIIADVKQFKGTYKQDGKNHKKGDPYVRYVVVDGGGAEYSTFSESLAEEARVLKGSGEKVSIEYEVSKFGNDLKGFKSTQATES